MARRGLHRERPGEAGISIILAFLVLILVAVVVNQVFFASQVEMDQVGHHVNAVQMRALADACRLQAESVLLMDLESGSGGQDAGGGADGGEDLGAGGLGSALGGGGSAAGGEEGGVTSATDSLLDEWQNTAQLAPSIGQDWTLYVEIQDEDAKINLLGLWAEDDDKRDEWREVFTRLLDKLFEGTEHDLTVIDAQDLIGDLDDWVRGERGLFDRMPLPVLKKAQAEEDADGEVDTSIIEDEEVHFPLTLEELLLLDGVSEAHFTGFVENDIYYPGLRDVLTLWTELELKEPASDDEMDESPLFSSNRGGFNRTSGQSVFNEGEGEAGEGGVVSDPTIDEQQLADDALTADPTNDGLVNVNTATLQVLRAVAPEDIPTSFLERIIEYRERILELQEDAAEGNRSDFLRGGSSFDDEGDDAEGEGGDQTGEDEDDEDDPTRYVFQAAQEVFEKVESEFDLSVFTEETEKAAFTSRLTVRSQVFTIRVRLQNQITGRTGWFRTIVWRMETPDGPRIVTLRPLEEYHDPRREQDLPEGMAEASEDRFWRDDR